MEERKGDTHPMETNISETSTIGVERDLSWHNLVIGIWEPFHLSKVINLRIFTYDINIGSIL